MNTEECFALIENKFKHWFEADKANNSITLKPGFEKIPQFNLVCVEGGEFKMGENGYYNFEKPTHKVKVGSFFMAEFCVTQELYRGVTGQSSSRFEGVDHPVEKVSWYDAVAFCNLLNEQLKLPKPYSGKDDGTKCNFNCVAFRLPTEAEWEYAARGGKAASKQYQYTGSDYPDDVAWYDKNNNYETKPVGLKFPNSLGLYDMSGNVWEWCWDWYDESYYEKCNSKGVVANPKGSDSGSSRVVRGGSWNDDSGYCRVASRFIHAPGNKWHIIGLRLVLAFQFTSEPGQEG